MATMTGIDDTYGDALSELTALTTAPAPVSKPDPADIVWRD